MFHARQSILSFHIIFLLKSHFKDKETQIQRGKFPSHGHPVVRRRPTIQTQSGFKAGAFAFEHFKEALHPTRGSTFLYASCSPNPNLESHISKHPHPAQIGFHSIRSSVDLKELQIHLKSQANLKINQEYLFCSKQMPNLMC